MGDHELSDGVVRLCAWTDDDAAWYADTARDPLIQRFTSDSPTLTAEQVRAAIARQRGSDSESGFLVRDERDGTRLANVALLHDGTTGEVSYWVAPEARGRGVATRAITLISEWSFRALGLRELWLVAHRDNAASQRAAERAGYRRAPERDKAQVIKGSTGPMLGFALSRPNNRVRQ
jgi:RimJ/RimL family protein N-acetyltransferase